MTKKVLILSGSPRRNGNTDLLCEAFCQGAAGAGHDTRVVRLADLSLAPCLACDHCRRTDGECVLKDDMAGLLDEALGADVIVLASPVYFYSLTATMKMFIDRTYARHAGIKGKEFYLAALAADTNPQALDLTLECLRVYTSYLQCPVRGVIRAAGVWERGDVRKHAALDEARRMGTKV